MKKTDLLLYMLEHPRQYTADQWQEILANDECRELYTLMSKTQSAVDATHIEDDITDEFIDAEWQKTKQSRPSQRFSILFKVAAVFVGVILLSGIAYAALSIISHINSPKEQDVEAMADTSRFISHPSLLTDTIATQHPKLYDNVPLGEIFEELSVYYNVKVVFQNDEASRLRLYYQWKPEYSMEKVVEMLNNFDRIQILAKNDTLFIRTTAIPGNDR